MARRPGRFRKFILLAAVVACASAAARAQISPTEITNPRLKAPERVHFQQLIGLSRAIDAAHFPYRFSLRRYIGLSSKNPLGADTRGIQFVLFHGHVILKISGNYEAALNAEMLGRNQRARLVFADVVEPILRIIPQYSLRSTDFDGYGVEIAYHVRSRNRQYDFEGVEILTMVFSKAALVDLLQATNDAQRQAALDASLIYMDGKRFGLALDGNAPYPVADLQGAWIADLPTANDSPGSRADVGAASSRSNSPQGMPPQSVGAVSTQPRQNIAGLRAMMDEPPPDVRRDLGQGAGEGLQRQLQPDSSHQTGATQAEIQTFQIEYAAQLESLGKVGVEKYHFVSYAAPFFVTFHHQIYLQLTLRNPRPFDASTTSIYQRAAQDFDLFFAPMLPPLLARIPLDPRIEGLDVTILDQATAGNSAASKAFEFACPLPLLRQLARANVTSQDVINRSAVMVNGVRIALNLERAE